MAYNNLEIGNQPPCQDVPGSPGVYYVNIHFRGHNGLRHESVETGDTNPLDFPIGELSMIMLKHAIKQSGDRSNGPQTPSRLVGMSVMRACIHEYETPEHRTDHTLLAEKFASFAFVEKTGVYYPASYAYREKPSQYGVVNMRLQTPNSYRYSYVQHLDTTPGEAEAYSVQFATPSVSARGKSTDTWVALRPKTRSKTKQRNSFVERLVTVEELRDTMK
jgi:hypothetical protein